MKLTEQAETQWTRFLGTHSWTLIVDPKTLDNLRKRFERAQNLEAYWMTHGLWAVESQTDPGLAYRVSLAMNDCECRDHQDGKSPMGWCKHLLAAWYTEQLISDPIEYTDLEAPTPDPQEVAEAALAEWEWVQETEARINGLY